VLEVQEDSILVAGIFDESIFRVSQRTAPVLCDIDDFLFKINIVLFYRVFEVGVVL